MPEERTITALPRLVAELGREDRELFTGIFQVTTGTGRVLPPPEMDEWIGKRFGPVDHVKNQEIIRVTNLVTLEGALSTGSGPPARWKEKPPARSWKRSSGPKAAHFAIRSNKLRPILLGGSAAGIV